MNHITIIGAGFSGLSAACYLARDGYKVTVYEKNKTIGGRAGCIKWEGFSFDTGPTFYWMPDVFEKFFADFGESPVDYYSLKRLDPGYKIYFGPGDSIEVPTCFEETINLFEQIESGSGRILQEFMKGAAYNYKVAMDSIVYRPGKSALELVTPETIRRVSQFMTTLSYTVRKDFKNPRLRQILEFPVLFLGARSCDMPSFYRFMNYADMKLGTWHVEGGIYKLVEGIGKLAEKLGVVINTGTEVEKIVVEKEKASGVWVNGIFHDTDIVISGADYYHTESLLDPVHRNYNERYWKGRVMAPSAYLYYIAFNRKLSGLSHHTLFFDTNFNEHADKIYRHPGWPDKPLFYTSIPSLTDPTMAPDGKESMVILIPLAPDLDDTQQRRDSYFEQVIQRLEYITGQQIRNYILFYRSYGTKDFIQDFNAYKGNAYGLSNILTQTAFMKPKVENRKIKNMFYTGQLTVPGPGVPTTLISGKIVANEAIKSAI